VCLYRVYIPEYFRPHLILLSIPEIWEWWRGENGVVCFVILGVVGGLGGLRGLPVGCDSCSKEAGLGQDPVLPPI
jgi:hypothetical protein